MPNDSTAAEGINSEGFRKTLKAVTSMYQLTVIDGGSSLDDLMFKRSRVYNHDIYGRYARHSRCKSNKEDCFLSLQQCFFQKK